MFQRNRQHDGSRKAVFRAQDERQRPLPPILDSHDLTKAATTVLVLGDEAKSKEERRLVQKLGKSSAIELLYKLSSN